MKAYVKLNPAHPSAPLEHKWAVIWHGKQIGSYFSKHTADSVAREINNRKIQNRIMGLVR